jgi:hypothetical protein
MPATQLAGSELGPLPPPVWLEASIVASAVIVIVVIASKTSGLEPVTVTGAVAAIDVPAIKHASGVSALV